MIIAMDADTFELESGRTNFVAQNIANAQQSALQESAKRFVSY
jgi:flagellar basal body rod protein FlgC